MIRFSILLVAFVFTSCAPAPPALVVSAASDLQPALTEIAAQFERETGTRVTINFGSSGLLAQQIAQGAPVDVFAAANRAYVDDLAARGIILTESVRVYARGRLVIWTRGDAIQAVNDLARPGTKRIAIANPEHAPYGIAAREALENAGVWRIVQPKLVLAENVQQAKQYAETGNVDAAIIARSNAGSTGRVIPVPQELYRPLDQALGVVKASRNEKAARAFADYITSSAGRAVLGKYGFGVGD